jgi:hypothetical protein
MPDSRRWYIAQLPRAHQGTGRSPVYERVAIWAFDVVDCLKRIRQIPSYKRTKYATVQEATTDECRLIERVIAVTPSTSLRKAKREWLFLFADVVEKIERDSASNQHIA